MRVCSQRITLTVKDPTTEWDMRLMAFLKNASLGTDGGLEPLLHEQWMMHTDPSTKNPVPEERLRSCMFLLYARLLVVWYRLYFILYGSFILYARELYGIVFVCLCIVWLSY